MIKEINSHKLAYSVLTLALFSFVLFFLQAWPDRNLQKMAVIGMGVFYFFWGVIVHVKSEHINSRIVFEYLAVSVLAVSLLLLLLS
jgi:hypothetical protein